MWAMIEKFRIRSSCMAIDHAIGATCSVGDDDARPLASSRCSVARFRARPTTRPNEERLPVANIKSQKKRNITNAKAAERNKATRSELKSRTKTAVRTIGDDSNPEAVRVAVKKIDSAASKGVIHKNTAARRKSRLMKKVNAAG
jgi:small subunit ribosomal protein S20